MPMLFHLGIVQIIASGCCDFIAQCIIVSVNHCTYHCTYHPFYSPKSSQKTYRCWIMWNQDIRFVIIPSFLAIVYLGQSISIFISYKPISPLNRYMASDSWLIDSFTSTPILWYMGVPSDPNKFRRVHGREYHGDGLDRVQNPQGVFGS